MAAVASPSNFHIRRTFLLPLGLLLALCLALLAISIYRHQPVAKPLILGCIILPVLILFIESVFRRAVIGDDRITVLKLLRRKTLVFSDITAVETVMVRKRAFLTVCAGDEFLILSNAYADFPGLVRELLGKVPPAAVSEESRQMAAAPPVKSSDIVSCWLGVALMAWILYLQLAGSR